MNPFENENETENKLDNLVTTEITVWKESRGRKTNTYVTGWNLEKEELKGYLKEFKQKKGCNGSLKTDDDEGHRLHFQGDKINDIIEFMLSKGVTSDSIITKGM